jgi:glycosyltransferase involved in cell wall biosynthesis
MQEYSKTKNKSLIIISQSHPFGSGEDFMDKEIHELAKKFKTVEVFPLQPLDNIPRKLPENCNVRDHLSKDDYVKSALGIIKNFRLIFSIIFLEYRKSGRSKAVRKQIKFLISQILRAKHKGEKIEAFLKENNIPSSYCYSVWMNEGALIFAILKKKKRIDSFFFRLHGYDLFDERRPMNYMPFRVFDSKHAKQVFVLSKNGCDYIKKKNIYPEKLIVNYSGLYDHGIGPFSKDNSFTLVSCSTMHKFKRIDIIIDCLKKIDFQINWIHFGGGEEMDDLVGRSEQLPDNIKVNFKGRVVNEVVLDFYKNNQVNLFIHLSSTEGLGMAAVEAQSFGVPSLSIDVGGVSEVVNENTGVLLQDEGLSAEVVADEIIKFKDSIKNTSEFRKEVRSYFLEHFEARKNYDRFYQLITKS